MPSLRSFSTSKALCCSTAPFRVALLLAAIAPGLLRAETCTTQSQMKPADRDGLVDAARSLSKLVQTNNTADLRQKTLPEYAKDFSGMTSLVGTTAPKIKDASLVVDQVYLLDATSLKPLADGTNQDAQFFCSLNKSIAEASFLIPALPPGRYAFAMVTAQSSKTPWRLSFLLEQSAPNAPWSMAGFYPKPLTAATHDGLWYWTQARDLTKAKQLWTAYFYYQEAQALLQPAGFVTSTHLDKLRKESTAAAPPALSEGITAEAPLVVKGPGGSEFRFTDLTTDDSIGADRIDIVAHLAPEPAPETASAEAKPKSKSEQKADAKAAIPPLSPRDRNAAAMTALLAAYPELRTSFHGVWIFADSSGQNPFVTEQPMANIH